KGINLYLAALPLALRSHFQSQEALRVNVDIPYVAALQCDLQLVNVRAFHVFLPGKLYSVALCLVINERAVHIRLLLKIARAFLARFLRVWGAFARIYLLVVRAMLSLH